MSGHLFPFLIDRARDVYIMVGDIDPTAAPGIAAESSLYLKVDAATKSVTVYARTGPDATAWTVLGGVPTTLPAGVTVEVQDEAAQEGGEIVLRSANGNDDWHYDVLGDAIRWFTDGAVKMRLWRDGSFDIGDIRPGKVIAVGACTQNGVDVAKVVWSTAAPSGTPASGVGTIWVQY